MEFDVSLNNYGYATHNIDKNIMQPLDNTFFPLDTSLNNICVHLSGGADSACGTAILCDYISKLELDITVYVISYIRVWNNRPWAEYISLDVYHKIQSMFPNVKMKRETCFVPPELEDRNIGTPTVKGLGKKVNLMQVVIDSHTNYFIAKNNIQALYNFTTANPTHLADHDSAELSRNVTKTHIDNGQKIQYSECDTYYEASPWVLLQKDFILGQYYKRGWEDLLDITRSCEGDKKLFDHKYTNHFVDYTEYKHGETPIPECHEITKNIDEQCFWCAERQWAKQEAKEKLYG